MKKIIISGEETSVKPWAAFIMSLLVTGLGQVYCGTAARGTTFMLARVLTVISVPCFAVLNPGKNLINEISAAILIFVIITLASPAETLLKPRSSRRIKKRRYNTYGYYSVYSAVSIMLTALSLLFFFSCFTFYRAGSDYSPQINRGEILTVNRIRKDYHRGEVVIYNYLPLRIMALPGENAEYRQGKFYIDGSELQQSVFTEDELELLSVQDIDVISETNGPYMYAVTAGAEKFTIKSILEAESYFAVPDDRKSRSGFMYLKRESITGVLEGILFSPLKHKVNIVPALMPDMQTYK